MNKNFLSLLTLVCSVCAARPQGTFEAISSFVPGSISAPVSGAAGWTFVPLQGIQITALGCADLPTDSVVSDWGPLSIGLWTDSGSLLVATNIYTTNTLVNQSRYVSITPFTLAAGQTYRLGIFSTTPGFSLTIIGPPPNFDGSATLDPLIQLGSLAQGNSGFGFPNTLGPSGTMYVGPNFMFRNLPEPSAFGLVAVGLFLAILHRRNP